MGTRLPSHTGKIAQTTAHINSIIRPSCLGPSRPRFSLQTQPSVPISHLQTGALPEAGFKSTSDSLASDTEGCSTTSLRTADTAEVPKALSLALPLHQGAQHRAARAQALQRAA